MENRGVETAPRTWFPPPALFRTDLTSFLYAPANAPSVVSLWRVRHWKSAKALSTSGAKLWLVQSRPRSAPTRGAHGLCYVWWTAAMADMLPRAGHSCASHGWLRRAQASRIQADIGPSRSVLPVPGHFLAAWDGCAVEASTPKALLDIDLGHLGRLGRKERIETSLNVP